MSSSDSEEGFYGNAALKLQKLRNTRRKDNTPAIVNISSDTEDSLNIISKTTGKRKSPRKKSESIFKKPKSAPVRLNDDDVINDLLGITRRVTRSSSRSSSDASTHSNDHLNQSRKKNTGRSRGRGRGRGRGKGRSTNRSSTQNTHNTNHGRGRRICNAQVADIPTYSIGNTDEYPDELENKALFSKTNDIVRVEDDSQEEEDNEELSVKIYWQSSEIFTFNIRKYQKLAQIFEHFAKKENVSHDKLLFTFNDKILKPEDTPDTIDYNIAKFIDGGIVKQSVSHLLKSTDSVLDKEIKNGIKVKFQCEKMKKPLELTIGIDDTLSLAMLKCAEHIEKPLEKLKFEFDGDSISGKSTPKDLELEGGECIDVKIMS